jgi:hypothetical protein
MVGPRYVAGGAHETAPDPWPSGAVSSWSQVPVAVPCTAATCDEQFWMPQNWELVAQRNKGAQRRRGIGTWTLPSLQRLSNQIRDFIHNLSRAPHNEVEINDGVDRNRVVPPLIVGPIPGARPNEIRWYFS